MTGAEVPDCRAAVVPVELTDAERTGVVPASITVTGLPDPVVPGWNIRDVGEDTAAGDVVVLGGQRLGAAGIGTLAMLGIEAVDVARPARVGLVVTGDELQPGEGAPRIPNSNLPMLASALGSHGFTVFAGDERR